MTAGDKAVTEIPSTVTIVDMATGKEEHRPMAWSVLPPKPGHCQFCAVEHPPELPHNAQSLFYQMTFGGMIGRPPTWADAMAHCSDDVKQRWGRELRRLKAWSEPPNGERPVRHHGAE